MWPGVQEAMSHRRRQRPLFLGEIDDTCAHAVERALWSWGLMSTGFSLIRIRLFVVCRKTVVIEEGLGYTAGVKDCDAPTAA